MWMPHRKGGVPLALSRLVAGASRMSLDFSKGRMLNRRMPGLDLPKLLGRAIVEDCELLCTLYCVHLNTES
ncbi:hypothetical protein GE09DRAFT_1122335 [Coniochaeta sp. 2T2.1]|nr:hypothetical protein GE09DRAFT_1122335 [Coniochaeta sp. 2T2.1]